MQRWRVCAVLAAAVFGSSPVEAQESQAYVYDAHGRLSSVHRDTPSSSSVTAYALDGANNRAERASGPIMTAVWEAENLAHSTGYFEVDGRAADMGQPEGFLNGGPYTPAVPIGERVAVWRIMIDAPQDPAPAAVVRLDVWDINAGQSLAVAYLPWSAWRSAWSYQYFELPFTIRVDQVGHEIEFRTYFYPIAHVRVDKVGYR